MDRVTKEEQVGELKDKLARTSSVLLADYRGLDVPTVTDLRNQFRKAQCEYKVYKNTLVKLAIKGTSMEGMGKHLEGPTAIIFSWESPAASAKVATKIAKDQEKFILKGVEGLAKMPGKDELRAKLLATFQAPATDLVRTINAGAQNFLYLLAAKERAGGEAGK